MASAVVESSYSALVAETKQDTLNKSWKEDKSSFGYKMMLKMGWSEGRGLGKELQGDAKHVTLTKKIDKSGLGTVRDDHGNLGWTAASAGFDSVLSQLNARYGAKAEQEDGHKKKKKKKKNSKRDGDQKAAVGKASMLLRHPKLLKSKNIRQYSAHDMSAILGIKRTDETTGSSNLWPLAGLASIGATKEEKDEEEKQEEGRAKEEDEREEEEGREEEEEEEETDVVQKKESSKKRKKRKKQREEVEEEAAAEKEQVVEAVEEGEKKDRKKKRKDKKKDVEVVADEEEEVPEAEERSRPRRREGRISRRRPR